MSGLYLYCITGAGHPPPGAVTGISGATVEAREAGGLGVWASTMPAPPAPSLDRVREHNRVVEAACDTRTALPLRFGQWFEDPDALEERMREQAASLRVRLRRVNGALEMGVRVMDPALQPAAPDRSTGRAYLEALARREHDAEAGRARGVAVAAELRDWLGARVRDERVRPLGTVAGLVAVAHLVGRHDIGSYEARAREFPPRHPELRFLFSGPWPPYGFADDDGP